MQVRGCPIADRKVFSQEKVNGTSLAPACPADRPRPARPLPYTDALDSCCSLSPKASIGGRNDREPAPAWFQQEAHPSESHS